MEWAALAVGMVLVNLGFMAIGFLVGAGLLGRR